MCQEPQRWSRLLAVPWPALEPGRSQADSEADGRALRTALGRVVQIQCGPPPNSAAIVEWDSLDDAVAFYNSKARTDLAPQRDNANKVIRRYVVETEK